MSLARMGCDGSHVYVYVTDGGIACCFCSFVTDESADDIVIIPKASEMLAHLEAHRAKGETVPEHAMEQLREMVPTWG